MSLSRPIVLFSVYVAVSFLTTVGLALLRMQPKGFGPATGRAVSTTTRKPDTTLSGNQSSTKAKTKANRFFSAFLLCCTRGDGTTRPSALLLSPKQILFGSSSSLLGCYVIATLVVNTVRNVPLTCPLCSYRSSSLCLVGSLVQGWSRVHRLSHGYRACFSGPASSAICVHHITAQKWEGNVDGCRGLRHALPGTGLLLAGG